MPRWCASRPRASRSSGTPEGIERLGGVDFDEAILSYVDYTADGALSKLDMSDAQTAVALARLRQDCVLAKEALSLDTEAIIPVFLPGRHLDVRLTRAEFRGHGASCHRIDDRGLVPDRAVGRVDNRPTSVRCCWWADHHAYR